MPNAAILEEFQPVLPQGSSYFVRTDDFEDVIYDIRGFLHSFVYKGIKYVHCNHESFYDKDLQRTPKIKEGFYNEIKYREYMLQEGRVTIFDMVGHNFTYKYKFKKAEAGDTIITVKPEINETKTWFYRTEFSWPFDPNGPVILETYSFERFIITPDTATKNRNNVVNYAPEAVSFFEINANKILSPDYKDDVDQSLLLLARTVITIQNTIVISFDPFYGDSECEEYINEQKLYWQTTPISQQLSYSILSVYYSNLAYYREEIYKNQHNILGALTDNKLYTLACGLTAASLNLLPIQSKKEMLTESLKRMLASSDNEEQIQNFVLRILMSFREDEETNINIILKYLLKTLEDDKSKTYYEAFFNIMGSLWDGSTSIATIGDWLFQSEWNPSNTRDAYVKAVYILWLKSKYNPYKVGANEEGEYKENIGIRIGSGDNVQYEVPYLNTVSLTSLPPGYVHYYTTYENKFTLDYDSETVTYEIDDAAPIVINYESTRKGGFFDDNFRFIIHGTKILAVEEYVLEGGDGDHLDRYFNILRGTYDLFQPVQLMDINQDTIIPMPLVSGTEINAGGTNINSLIPVFILKYIDDNGDWSDLEKAIGVYYDVISTVSGLGNLAKLRHLRHLSKIEYYARSIIGTIELTASIASTISSYVCSDDPIFCDKLNKFFFLVELATLSVDSLYSTSKAQRAARDLKDHMDEFGTPSNFNHTPTIQLILDLADVEGYLERIKTKITNTIRKEIKRQNEVYKRIDNLVTGTVTKAPPRFSLKKFTVSKEEVIVNGKTLIAEVYTKTANDLHSAGSIEEMIEHAIALNIVVSDVEGLLLKSYRTAKQAEKVEVMLWMDTYSNFLKPVSQGGRGRLAYCFHYQAHFELFANQYKSLCPKYKLDILDKFTIGGSSLTKILPADLDFIHYISSQKFDVLIDHYKANLKRFVLKNPDNKVARDFVEKCIKKSINRRKIDPGCMIYFDDVNNKLEFFIDEFKNLSSVKNLNVEKKKLFDFNIFDASVAEPGINPEYTYNLK